MTTRSLLSRLLVVAGLVLGSTACVAIPHSSSVKQAGDVGVQNQSPPPGFAAPPPALGASPKEIVDDFYIAMLAYPQDTETARQFLTPDAAASWDPKASLVVYSEPETRQVAGDVVFTATASGSLDDRGTWTSVDPLDKEIRVNLHMVKVDGEWRISDPQPGIFITSASFDSSYAAYSLYFFDPTLTVLTPDPIHLVSGEPTPTALVEDLLRGPTKQLVGAVATAVPAGTDVDVAVSVSNGLAEVPLSDDVLKLSPEDRQLLAAQLTWTLRQVDGIEAIAITVDGANLSIPNVGNEISISNFSGYDPAGFSGEHQLFALAKDGLVTVEGSEATPVVGPIREVSRGRSAAINASGTLAAIVRSNGRAVVVGDVQAPRDDEGLKVWLRDATQLLRPSWDIHSVLWLVDRTDRGARLWAVTADGTRQVVAPGITGRDVVSFAVSRDGVRLASIVREGDTTTLQISIINRDPEKPDVVSLREAHEVVSANLELGDLSGLAWLSPAAVAVIGREPGGDVQPYEVAIDGSSTTAAGGFLGATPLMIAAGPIADAPIAIAASGGRIYVQRPELDWAPVGGETRLIAPVYPG